MAGYVEVSDEDRRWAESSYSEHNLFRGPCAPILNYIDSAVDWLREQPPVKSVLVLIGIFLCMGVVNLALEDEHVAVLVKGGDECAIDKDFLQKANHRCKVEDKLALGFLNGATWVNCAKFTRGASILMQSRDDNDNYWYDLGDKHKVAFFYSTCNPTCASETDEYHADLLACDHGVCDKGLCKVSDYNALSWLEGKKTGEAWPGFSSASKRGYNCRETPRTRPGIAAVQSGTEGAKKNNDQVFDGAAYWYDPKEAMKVRAFYSECSGPCACNDLYDSSTQRCKITDPDVRIFFDPATNAPGAVTGQHGERINVMNAYCKQLGGEIQAIKRQGQLSGDWKEMSYLPAVKSHVSSELDP